MLSGILRFAAEHQEIQIILLDPKSEQFKNELPNLYQTENLDGIIAAYWHGSIRITKPKGKWFIQLNNNMCPTTEADGFVDLDDKLLVSAAADLLLKRGYRNFAYIGSSDRTEQSRTLTRRNIFKSVLESAGFLPECYEPHSSNANQAIEISTLANWLKTLTLPCGILAYADTMARLTIDACHLAHIIVPDQISVIGIDNDSMICDNIHPTLTSIWPDFEQGGYQAAEMMWGFIHHEKSQKRPIRTTYGLKGLVERSSTVDLRGGGRLISLVTAYIRKHFNDPNLNAEHLARQHNVSRRLLDIRAAEILGMTIKDYLRKIRLQEAKLLLRTTELPIGEISDMCGYNSPIVFRRSFKELTSLTPTQWRNR